MQSKAITEVIEQHFNSLRKLTRKVVVSFDRQAIHQLREEMKKLRAFLHLLDTEEDGKDLRIRRRLKSFNGYIGIIRNMQLQEHLMQELIPGNTQSIEPYLRHLKSEMQLWKKEIMKLTFDHLDFDEERDALLKQVPRELSKLSVKKFLRRKTHEIESLVILRPVKENNLHELRKILKDLLYNWPYVKSEAETALPFEMNSHDRLETLAGILGTYGDQCAALDLLQPGYIEKVPDARGRELLEQACIQLEHRKEHTRGHFFYTLLSLRQSSHADNTY